MLVAKRATPSPVTLQYADIFKIPRILSVPFSRDVERWIKCSGIEWTVKRLKDMKLDLVRLKAGLLPVLSGYPKKIKSSKEVSVV
jgi:hypothetical protein